MDDQLTGILSSLNPNQIQLMEEFLRTCAAAGQQTSNSGQKEEEANVLVTPIESSLSSTSSKLRNHQGEWEANPPPLHGLPLPPLGITSSNTTGHADSLTYMNSSVAQSASSPPAPSGNTANGNQYGDSDEDSEDIPLFQNDAWLSQSTVKSYSPLPMNVTTHGRTTEDLVVQGKAKAAKRQGRKVGNEPNKKANEPSVSPSMTTTATPQAVPVAPTTSTRGLASYGFVVESKKITSSTMHGGKLFTPFVQDKRIVPPSLQFWSNDSDRRTKEEISGSEDVLFMGITHSASATLNGAGVYDDNANKGFSVNTRFRAEQQEALMPYQSFTAMIEAATLSERRDVNDSGYIDEAFHRCPCSFHLHCPPPRKSFRDEFVFCAFYAIAYDPCQSRPPYFGTYNSQDSLNLQELMQLGRFAAGTEMPQMSNLDYEYDSGDDWDIVEDDEDLGDSSSGGTSSQGSGESNDETSSGSDDKFINDNDDYEDDSEAELQRRMFESRQRRTIRLRQKDKFVPAFSGPFTGLSSLDHPLRDYDRFERISSALDADTFTSIFDQGLRSWTNPTVLQASPDDDGESRQLEEVMNRHQRLSVAALRSRRELLPEELESIHTIVKANAKITLKGIVNLLLEQGLCVGVARAEIDRTIRRFYERNHSLLVRRKVPWSSTDERLFPKYGKPKAGDSDAICTRSDADGTEANFTGDGGGGVLSNEEEVPFDMEEKRMRVEVPEDHN
uniref:WGS project CAEQ00000000 data, annotated contig 895 n=1 Tax=Trypanosoma congolense (strain IL3000) TaxID=1068625 RepID=F9WJC0_TRYCI|nr:unnamed protein product [Trypanosoma congolense IL3000]